jgi:hypothetical protein
LRPAKLAIPGLAKLGRIRKKYYHYQGGIARVVIKIIFRPFAHGPVKPNMVCTPYLKFGWTPDSQVQGASGKIRA